MSTRSSIRVELGQRQKERLIEAANDKGVSVSDLAARAIGKYLDEIEERERESMEWTFRKVEDR